MNTPPPLYRDQRAVDREHLNLLSVFHFVVAGLAILGLGFLFIHYLLMSTIFTEPSMTRGFPKDMPPPEKFFSLFKYFYLIFGAISILAAIGNLLSGLFIRARKHRGFSFAIAALNCLQIPFGTLLGVFTIIVLARDSVRELYDQGAAP